MHDRGTSGLLQCSSGTISAAGTLRLPPLAGGDAALEAAAGDADAGADADGWRHVTLELEGGRATRLAQKLEDALEKAGEAEDHLEAALDGSGTGSSAGSAAAAAAAGGATAAAAPADASVADGGNGAAAPAAGAGAEAAAAAAAADALPASSGSGLVEVPLDGEASEAADVLVPAGTIRLRLSWRPLQQPASALPTAVLSGAAAEAQPAPPLQQTQTFIRLLSGRREEPMEVDKAAAAAAAEEEGRRRRRAAEDAVQQGLPVELPLDPLPLHLHTYGHGGAAGLGVRGC